MTFAAPLPASEPTPPPAPRLAPVPPGGGGGDAARRLLLALMAAERVFNAAIGGVGDGHEAMLLAKRAREACEGPFQALGMPQRKLASLPGPDKWALRTVHGAVMAIAASTDPRLQERRADVGRVALDQLFALLAGRDPTAGKAPSERRPWVSRVGRS